METLDWVSVSYKSVNDDAGGGGDEDDDYGKDVSDDS